MTTSGGHSLFYKILVELNELIYTLYKLLQSEIKWRVAGEKVFFICLHW